MQYCVDHPEEMNKLAKVQAQISEVKGVMMENIEKVWESPKMQIECHVKIFHPNDILMIGLEESIGNCSVKVICHICSASLNTDCFCLHLFEQVLDRGEKIELLVDKTENLRSQVCDSSIDKIASTPIYLFIYLFILVC